MTNAVARFQYMARGFAGMINDRSAEVLQPNIMYFRSQLTTCTGSESCLR